MAKKLKIPANHIIVGLVAFALLLGAPAIVALIDETAHIDLANPIEYNETNLLNLSNLRYNPYPSGDGITMSVTALYPSENDGTYLLSTGVLTGVKSVNFYIHTQARTIFEDSSEIHVTVEEALTMNLRVVGSSPTLRFFFEEVSPGNWVLDLSPADRLLLKSSTGVLSLDMSFDDAGTTTWPSNGILEIGFAFFDSPIPIFYASFVWGAVGVILLITAIYASHLVKVGDVSKAIKKAFTRKKKGGKK